METKVQAVPDLTLPSATTRLRTGLQKSWYKFSRNKLSVIGLAIVLSVIFLAIFAPYISPYPQHG